MDYILGLNVTHGESSASLFADGELAAAVEEERFNRIKYTSAFPSSAVRYCLREAGISIAEVRHIAIGRDPKANLHRKAFYVLSHGIGRDALTAGFERRRRLQGVRETLSAELSVPAAAITARIHYVEHHLAHAASSFLVSGFDSAAILSLDGFGDFLSGMFLLGKDRDMRNLRKIYFPHSLGLAYTAVTQYCGLTSYGDEGKLMGLAAYGTPVYRHELEELVRLQPDGGYLLDLKYFLHHQKDVYQSWNNGRPRVETVYSRAFTSRFGPARAPRTEIGQKYADMAASVQALLEDAVIQAANTLHAETGEDRLCLAGGVALNSVANGKLLLATPFRDLYIQPAAGDAGLSLGAAAYVQHTVLRHPRRFVMVSPYTGPAYSDDEMRAALEKYGLSYERLDDRQLTRRTAALIAERNVVGWYQGRMEFGPRALGNRSIVADPRCPEMKDILNSRIKHRESFRPFAPSILEERVGEYFEQSHPDPFMLKVYKIKPEKRSQIPAVTHADGTGRLQTVSRKVNPRYWQLIKDFEELTGVPVIVNTSFNENEPIVNLPAEAIECFLRTRMDYLVLGNYIASKTDAGISSR